MKRLLTLIVIISSVLSLYSYYGTFSYFSDIETIENVTIKAGTWTPEVEVLYPNPILVLHCGGSRGDLSFNVTPRGWKDTAGEVIGPPRGGTECWGSSCKGVLTNVWIRSVGGNATLRKVSISWSGGGELERFWIGCCRIGRIGQTSPAVFTVNKMLKEGIWYPIAFEFKGMELRESYSFTITFFFDGNYTRTISFRLGG
ncbi:SipW-dependent-type signal peptide-containing protein [Thermococcus gorgonarius]|nr:SipW-dependent-type signal peptide-containing protein [Thermococcus gorgonarius]